LRICKNMHSTRRFSCLTVPKGQKSLSCLSKTTVFSHTSPRLRRLTTRTLGTPSHALAWYTPRPGSSTRCAMRGGKGEVVNRAVSSSTQRGVAAAAVSNVDSSWLHRLDVSAPSYMHQFDGALLDIRPRVSFRQLCGVQPACRRRFRSAFDSHGACADFVPRGARLTRRRVTLFA